MDVTIQHIQNWLIQKNNKYLIYSNNYGSLFVQKHLLKKLKKIITTTFFLQLQVYLSQSHSYELIIAS